MLTLLALSLESTATGQGCRGREERSRRLGEASEEDQARWLRVWIGLRSKIAALQREIMQLRQADNHTNLFYLALRVSQPGRR